jgi:hypothetical protein
MVFPFEGGEMFLYSLAPEKSIGRKGEKQPRSAIPDLPAMGAVTVFIDAGTVLPAHRTFVRHLPVFFVQCG